jgi:hypothetical protein
LLTIFLLSINVSASACILIYFGFIFWLLDRTLRSPSNQASIARSKSHLSAAEQITSLKNTYREALVYKKKYFSRPFHNMTYPLDFFILRYCFLSLVFQCVSLPCLISVPFPGLIFL